MKCIISHTTALLWLMRSENQRLGSQRPSRTTLAGAGTPRPAQAQAIAHSLWLETEEPLDVLVGAASKRQTVPGVRCHLCSAEPPAGSLIAIPSPLEDLDLYVCAPEFVFVQMAYLSDLQETIYYGGALCSEYRIDPVARGGVTLREYRDAPLTSAARLKAYLERTEGVPGLARAKEALPYLLEHARSPKENALGMLFGLPIKLGGCHLGDVTLNERFEIPDGTDRYGNPRTSTRYPDFTIRSHDRTGRLRMVLADYDAFSVHANPHAMARDARRRNELATLNSDAYFAITTDDAHDFRAMEQLAERMRKALGRRREPYLAHSKDSAESRMRLERAWNAQHDLWQRFVSNVMPV